MRNIWNEFVLVMEEMFCRILGRYINYVGESTYKMTLIIQGVLFDLDMAFQNIFTLRRNFYSFYNSNLDYLDIIA